MRTIQVICPDRVFPFTFEENSLRENGKVLLNLITNDTLKFLVPSKVAIPFLIYNLYTPFQTMPNGYVYDTTVWALMSINVLNAEEKRTYLELFRSFNLKIDPTDLIFSDLSREIGDTVVDIDFMKIQNKIEHHHLTIGFCFLDAKNFIKLYKKFCFYDESDIPRYSNANTNNLMHIRVARDLILALLTRLELSMDDDSEDLSNLNKLKTELYMKGTQKNGSNLMEYIFPLNIQNSLACHYTEEVIRKGVDELVKNNRKMLINSPYFDSKTIDISETLFGRLPPS